MGYTENFILEIMSNSISKKYDEAIDEWQDTNVRITEVGECICGHYIEENCIVKNELNNKELIIGNCCIKKFGIKKAPNINKCFGWNETHSNDICTTKKTCPCRCGGKRYYK